MTEPPASPTAPPPRVPEPDAQPNFRSFGLQTYLWSNRDRYTDDALANAARAAGYTEDEIASAARIVATRRADDLAVRPVKARARRYVLAAYAITFLVFAVAFLRPTGVQPNLYYYRGAGPIALAVLGFMLVISVLLALAWVAGQHPKAERAEAAFGVMLALPFVLLVIVAGLCVATTGSLIFAPAA